jgi:hypothetical protein
VCHESVATRQDEVHEVLGVRGHLSTTARIFLATAVCESLTQCDLAAVPELLFA